MTTLNFSSDNNPALSDKIIGFANTSTGGERTFTLEKINEMCRYEIVSTYNLSKDANDIFTVVQLKRADGTLLKVSTLSGGTTPEYETRVVDFYDSTGVTVLSSYIFDLSYTNASELSSEVLRT